jgi:hypothetical protein
MKVVFNYLPDDIIIDAGIKSKNKEFSKYYKHIKKLKKEYKHKEDYLVSIEFECCDSDFDIDNMNVFKKNIKCRLCKCNMPICYDCYVNETYHRNCKNCYGSSEDSESDCTIISLDEC